MRSLRRAVLIATVLLVWGSVVQAAERPIGQRTPEVRVFSPTGSLQHSFLAYDESYRGGVRVALGDVDGDGLPEIVTAPGPDHTPEIRIFSLDGTVIRSFQAYGSGFRGGVNLSVADLTGDGRAEIITAPSIGGGPEVRVYTGDGRKLAAFFAYERGFRGGVNVTAGTFGLHGEPLIVTAAGYGGNHVRGFTPSGKFAGINIRPFPGTTHGSSLTAIPRDGRYQLAVVPQRSANPLVLVYDLSRSNSPTKTFRGFRSTFEGGAAIASANLDGTGEPELVLGSGPGGQPTIRTFTVRGARLKEFLAYDAAFEGGVSVAASPDHIAVGPGSVIPDGRTDLYKYIEIDLSDQTLQYFQNGRRLKKNQVSTGKWTTPTPIGSFAIKNKILVAYSKPYDLYMDWWMAFTPDGSYGLHALPYWMNKDGSKRYEGERSIGHPASHGCIRQTLKEAEALFRWADIGTPVFVKR